MEIAQTVKPRGPLIVKKLMTNTRTQLKTADGGKLHHKIAYGGFAESFIVNASQVVILPDGISIKAASLFTCSVITGIGAVLNSAKVHPGQDVVIIGTGDVGLNANQGAKFVDARHNITVDMELTCCCTQIRGNRRRVSQHRSALE